MEEKKVEENEPREKEVVKKTEAAHYTWYMLDIMVQVYGVYQYITYPNLAKKG